MHRVRRIAEEEYILVVLMAGFGLIFLLIFPPALVVNDSWLNLMAGREVVENGLPSRDEITVYGLGATWTDQQWLAQVFMYGDLQPRRLRAAVARDVSLRRERVLHRRCRVAPARRRPACDLAHLPSRPHRSAPIGMVDPRADARAPPLHRPPLAPRDGGAVADETGLARAPTARVWANVHGSVVLGALLVMLLGAYELIRSRGRTWLRSIALVVLAPLAVLATPYGPVATVRYYHLLLVDPPFAGRVTEWSWAAPRGSSTSSPSTSFWR